MIVQSIANGERHFVMTMDQHTRCARFFAEHFGNEQFEPVEPRDLMLHVIGHHDAGWRELDAQALRDPATGLPYNLVQTPFEHIVSTSKASPDANSNYHPYCELISSMHSWGLYNGRYGMSDKLLLDSLAAENRALADRMLEGEVTRQNRIKAELAEDPQTAEWISEAHLFQNYKQLQFFDTLALYFNCVDEREREQTRFSHIPMNSNEDVSIEIKPLGDGVYTLSPYPFDVDALAMRFEGRYLAPVASGDDVRAALDAAPAAHQSVVLQR